jgi:hypothetical protein
MTTMGRLEKWAGLGALACLMVAGVPTPGLAQTPAPASLEIYGFGQADAIADFNQNDPKWYDVMRPSKLPKFKNEFGNDGRFYLSARQSRFGVRGEKDNVKATFEFDLFGVGADAGQTTIRLRHAFGQWKKVGAGQTNSQFMDIDVFPNTLDYWGPNGMLFFRNVQVFYEPIAKADGSRLRLAIEAAGASGDGGIYSDRVEIQNLKPRFPSPDYTGHYRHAASWGHLQLGGALRYLAYDDTLATDQYDLNGHTWGWGYSASSNVKVTPNDTLRLQFVQGAGIQNYYNDAPVDVAAEKQLEPIQPIVGAVTTPVKGKALPIMSFVAYLDHNWKPGWSTAIGYSRVDVDNSEGQAPNAYKNGGYFSANLLYAPQSNVMMGGEFQWLRRENNSDGFSSNDTRVQFSFKYSFNHKIGG